MTIHSHEMVEIKLAKNKLHVVLVLCPSFDPNY